MASVTVFGRVIPLMAFLYFAELVIAELVFCWGYKKRRLFWLTMPVSAIVLGFLSPFLNLYSIGPGFVRFLSLLLTIGMSVAVMLLSFEGDLVSIVISSIGGVAAQHVASKTFNILQLIPAAEMLRGNGILPLIAEFLVFSVVMTIIYAFFVNNLRSVRPGLNLGIISATIIILCIGVNRLATDFDLVTIEAKLATYLYAIISCVFALVIQVYIAKWQGERTDSAVMRRLLVDSEKQYGQWKTSAMELNVRYHDIKHMLDRVERLAGESNVKIPDMGALRRSVEELQPVVRTGNDVLDILFRNMDDLCRRENIRLQCIAYDDDLGHFDGIPLYYLFANTIDNAIEGARGVKDPDKRIIDISIRRFGDSVIIHIWNYFSGSVKFLDGLPVSSGGDEHGYGMRSIKLIVDSLGGALSASADGEIFNLDVILPINVEE